MGLTVLNIVSFDNPYPPNYGGVIDVFYKIKALHEIGFQIHLHCFVEKIPEEVEALNLICAKVYFYKTTKNPFHFLSQFPFSVISRSDKALVENLLKVDAPILFDGLKTSCLMNDIRLKKVKKFLRLHNIEHNYYKGIALSEKNFFRKMMFYFESIKYQRYESEIGSFDKVLTLSEFEHDYINSKFGNSVYVPVFHGNESVKKLTEFGKFTFYHGDLATSDNRKTVSFLIDVFRQMPECRLVIAAGSYETFVKNQITNVPNVDFVKLDNFKHLLELFEEAHINICWSFQKSGTKLKLINSLFNSRHCIINDNIIDDEKVSNLCLQVNSKDELIDAVKKMIQMPFSEFENRKMVLESHMNDLQNAKAIEKILSE